MFNILIGSHLAVLVPLNILSLIIIILLTVLGEYISRKLKCITTWQIDRLPVMSTWLGLVTQSVIWGSMQPTDQTSKNSVIKRWWKCPLPGGPSLALPHTNSWPETHFVLLVKIIICAVLQLTLSLSHWFVFTEAEVLVV